MEVINAAISVTRQTASERAQETVFEKFVEFNERLFCTSNHRHFKTLMGLSKNNQREGEYRTILKYYKDVLAGEVLEDENILIQVIDHFRDFLPFPKKDAKVDANKKRLSEGDYLQLIKEDYDDNLCKLKKEGKFAVAQKIPGYVKSFSKPDLK